AIDFRREPNSREFLRLSGARYTLDFNNNDVAFEGVSLSVPWEPKIQGRQARRHVAQEPLELVESLAAACRSTAQPEVAIQVAEHEEISELLRSLPAGDGPIVGMHPGAGRAIKCWAPQQFARLADFAQERLAARIVLFGGPGDEPLVERILEHMRDAAAALSLAG